MITPEIETEYGVRDYLPQDAPDLKSIKTEAGRTEAQSLPPNLRVIMRIAVAGEIGGNLSDPAEHLATGSKRLLVAAIAPRLEVVVGYCPTEFTSEEEVLIQEIVVHPNFIGEGIYSMLLNEAESHAKNAGAAGVAIWNYRHRESERRLLERRSYWYTTTEPDAEQMASLKPVQMRLALKAA